MRTMLSALCLFFGLVVPAPAAQMPEPALLEGDTASTRLAAVHYQARGGVEATTHAVLVWTKPPVTGTRYALRGTVSYEGVEGVGYLEMWNHFGATGSYFSRTLDDLGPMAGLRGSAEPRAFWLPFDRGPSATAPERIELNIVLPGPGTVTVSDLRWSADESSHSAALWWSERSTGLIGGGLGSLLGVAGALVGILCGIGRGRGIVLGVLTLEAALGAGLLVAGGLAFATAQPLHVAAPLLALGFVGVLLSALGRPVAKRRFHEIEMQRMRALDLDVGTGQPQH